MRIDAVSRKNHLARLFARGSPYLAVVFLVAVVVGLVLSGLRFESQSVAIYKQRSGLTANIEQIRLYDEALTDTARLAAASGSQSYERRYKQLAPQLDRIISETIRAVGTPQAAAKIAQTKTANRALVAMEKQSFRLDHAGALYEATALLKSPEFLRQKRIYAAATNQAFASFLAVSDRRIASINRNRVLALGIGGLSTLAVIVLGLVYLRRNREHIRLADQNEQRREESARSRAAEIEFHESQHEFTETLQVTRGEEEAHQVLKRHIERCVAASSVVVLNRNHSENRLQPMTRLPDDSPLASRLQGAQPDSCLAVRFGRPHERNGEREPLLVCELCAGACSTCIPSLVGGEVIGSVLVQTLVPPNPVERRRMIESVAQAAPVLANLRNLALASTQALTDSLTGLPNKRSIEDALKRMSAVAQRANGNLAAAIFDLDHFKRVNDVYGHERGDELLAAVGATISATLRTGDFAGRFGGEEFVLLLPDTDRDGALEALERLRTTISNIAFAGLPHAITASFGLAISPDNATEPAEILRTADRALYIAKSNGRNRVEQILPDRAQVLAPAATMIAAN